MEIHMPKEYQQQKKIKLILLAILILLILGLCLFAPIILYSLNIDSTIFVNTCVITHKGGVFANESIKYVLEDCPVNKPNCYLYCKLPNNTIINYYDMTYVYNATR
jgi:hypothetical protein